MPKEVFKVVKEEIEGELISLYAYNNTVSARARPLTAYQLLYQKDRATFGGTYGIWCCRDLKAARLQVKHNGNGLYCHIHKATTIGRKVKPPKTSSISIEEVELFPLYQGIILGDRIESYYNQKFITSHQPVSTIQS